MPTDQLDLLTRYVGGEAPALSKMGGSDWAAAKGKARRAVRDIAVELVKLYSARMASRGHAFPPDTPWQHELEEAFPFVETPDQLTTIDEVKRDMESPIPMDRLLSGDVGYGKTEVAVRAAFKAIQDGKQVAMIVPTTLLVKQHMETFAERFAGFPVHVRPLSRFQTDKEARETVAGLADGIGRHGHRNPSHPEPGCDLQGSRPRRHRRGAAVRRRAQGCAQEAQDQRRHPRDVGDAHPAHARDGGDRHPRDVDARDAAGGSASDSHLRRAVLRTSRSAPRFDASCCARARSSTCTTGCHRINRIATELAEIVPEARIAVAHGQLPEHVLEQVMVDFWERKFDVLVSTTIIETGLDIANANTLIIDRADKYGLVAAAPAARPRRSWARAGVRVLPVRRGQAAVARPRSTGCRRSPRTTTSGSGIQIALKDLEIRGAGNLLGGEQSGHIAGVGFDLYLRMIGEAVSAFRGDVAEGQTELRLELPVDAHIPEEYVESERLRLEAYQKLSTASCADIDRYADRRGARGAHRSVRRAARRGDESRSRFRGCGARR